MGCDDSVPPIDPIGTDRRWRNIPTSSATVPPVQIQHITQTIVLRVAFSSENGERNIAFNAYFRSARMLCPFMGRSSSPPQTWDFAVICAHVGAHAMLHSDIACAPAPGARLRAFRPEYQGKCRTRQFPLDNSRILRIQSVYTVIATPPEPVASAARLPVSATDYPLHTSAKAYAFASFYSTESSSSVSAGLTRPCFIRRLHCLPFLNNSASVVRFQHLAHLSSAIVL